MHYLRGLGLSIALTTTLTSTYFNLSGHWKEKKEKTLLYYNDIVCAFLLIQ
jgi:hypothetical protein